MMETISKAIESIDADPGKDAGFDIRQMLAECLGDGKQLAERIEAAARAAVSYHLDLQTQEMQSAVEAEYSTEHHAGSFNLHETAERISNHQVQDGSDSPVV